MQEIDQKDKHESHEAEENRENASVDSREENQINEKDQQQDEKPSPEEALNAQLEELKDKHLRLMAEFDNFRKRTAKERIEMRKTAGEDIVYDLLAVVDDFDRASASFVDAKDIGSVEKGVKLIFDKLKSILENKGLKEMKVMNETFDPELHEALSEVKVEKKKLKGKVVDIIQKGYWFNDKIVRHAKVVVGK